MASVISSTLANFGALAGAITGRRSCNLSPLVVQARHIQDRSSHQEATNEIKKGVNEALKTGDELKNKACSKTDEIFDESKGVAERAKKVAQDAWGSAKETAEKVSDSVVDKAEQSQGALKDAKEMAKRSMNTKKDPSCLKETNHHGGCYIL